MSSTIIINLEKYLVAFQNANTFWKLNNINFDFMTFVYSVKIDISQDKESFDKMLSCMEIFEQRLNSLPKPKFI